MSGFLVRLRSGDEVQSGMQKLRTGLIENERRDQWIHIIPSRQTSPTIMRNVPVIVAVRPLHHTRVMVTTGKEDNDSDFGPKTPVQKLNQKSNAHSGGTRQVTRSVTR